MPRNSRRSVNAYALSYTAWYIGLTVLIALIFTLLGWPGGVGTILLIAFGASWHAGRRFARDRGRAPSSLEGRAYAWRALLGSFVTSASLSTALAFLLFSATELQQVFHSLLQPDYIRAGLGVLLVMGLCFYAVIRLAFAWAGARNAPSHHL